MARVLGNRALRKGECNSKDEEKHRGFSDEIDTTINFYLNSKG
jgi:hypothetical protein